MKGNNPVGFQLLITPDYYERMSAGKSIWKLRHDNTYGLRLGLESTKSYLLGHHLDIKPHPQNSEWYIIIPKGEGASVGAVIPLYSWNDRI